MRATIAGAPPLSPRSPAIGTNARKTMSGQRGTVSGARASNAPRATIVPNGIGGINGLSSRHMGSVRSPNGLDEHDEHDHDDNLMNPFDRPSQLAASSQSRRKLKRVCKKIANHTYLSTLTGILTLCALFADDVNKIFFYKDTDYVFDIITIVCLTVFVFEIIVASIGQDEYFLNFFFWLDVVSTATLILDIKSVGKWLVDVQQAGADDEEGSGTQSSTIGDSGKTARAARIVRVIRLVRLLRILKLYKHLQEQRARRIAQEAQGKLEGKGPTDDDEEAEEEMRLMREPESKVGRKLSELSTRKVIILVLCMLFILPYIAVEEDAFWSTSYYFAAEKLWDDWKIYNHACVDYGADEDRTVQMRRQYEESLLEYIYYHQAGQIDLVAEDCDAAIVCVRENMHQLLFLALSGEDEGTSEEGVRCQGPHIQLLADQKDTFNKEYSGGNELLVTGPLSDKVLTRLTRPWKQRCDGRVGVSLDEEIECPETLRYLEIIDVIPVLQNVDRKLWPVGGDSYRVLLLTFNTRGATEHGALLNFIQTWFVCVVLAGGAYAIHRVATKLVLKPIERMIDKVKIIALDPLGAGRMGDNEQMRDEERVEKMQQDIQEATGFRKKLLMYQARAAMKKSEPMETLILEKTIIKIGGLLALGFGEAGGDVIGQNLQGASGAVNVLIPGRRMKAVFGVAKIQSFAIIAEVLQGDVMHFANEVSEIVHGFVDEFWGAPNKNMGETYVLVWRVPDLPLDWTDDGGAEEESTEEFYCDMALISVAKVIGAIRKSPTLARYSHHPGLQQHLGKFEIQLSFGLHFGWAIEGAIGSEFKIDVSYLSSNVNMAARLESLTADFSLRNLVSEDHVMRLSEELRSELRAIDNVLLSGFKHKQTIFTLDLDTDALDVLDLRTIKRPEKMKKFKLRQLREARKCTKLPQNGYHTGDVFAADEDIQPMRTKYTKNERAFLLKYDMAYRNYESGEWDAAKNMLLQTELMLGHQDGPSRQLRNFMTSFLESVPEGVTRDTWAGFREL